MTDRAIEVDFSENMDVDHPKCVHGPTLLFVSSSTRYFACSACRDRQQCDIYIPFNAQKQKRYKSMLERHQKSYDEFRERIRMLQTHRQRYNKDTNLHYCRTCSMLFADKERSDHADHDCIESLPRRHLQQPCRYILSALQNRRSDAQFFFSPTFVDYLVDRVILKGPWDGILCLGCPTIFEAIRSRPRHEQPLSYLLDYDSRLCSFYSSKQMLVYNMFNGHIFSDRKHFDKSFLSSVKHCLILIDPPFGGLHRALAHSIEQFTDGKQTDLILFSPYFLERWIVDAFPHVQMLDYKIEYSSMSTAHLCRGRKGTPVRMFTDIQPSKFPPLDEINYKYCLECDRYTLVTNQHCFQCRACTSKDGLSYRHCSVCQRCVKAERTHCSKCQVCHLPQQCMTKKRLTNASDDDGPRRKKVK